MTYKLPIVTYARLLPKDYSTKSGEGRQVSASNHSMPDYPSSTCIIDRSDLSQDDLENVGIPNKLPSRDHNLFGVPVKSTRGVV